MADWRLWLAASLVAGAGAAFLRHRIRNARPVAGDIWWATVPFARGQGAKLRPCLVLLNHRRGIVVLKITSQDKSHRRDHVLIPTRRWDPYAERDSFLNLGEPILVRSSAFQRRAGTASRSVRRIVAGRRGLSRRDLLRLADRQAERLDGKSPPGKRRGRYQTRQNG
ncbi:type II toxin-antitoxin system PemK/MazF family toxin [Couchioplanes caeruleus]|uniref:type II toxin-antitoxin system PemK/MazF family toxin n=1 Tax=Couchioplanes caeruleus TaxID=56438 RepID=UPI0020BDABE9|nr:type II toxin-antitoxin system PemK/MazF family toxin [Couchioplanes caeruleus]UQU66129.1 type II toxin-antitoxin system PemK/MazF family toxin [Couchioplanes caeruleus]